MLTSDPNLFFPALKTANLKYFWERVKDMLPARLTRATASRIAQGGFETQVRTGVRDQALQLAGVPDFLAGPLSRVSGTRGLMLGSIAGGAGNLVFGPGYDTHGNEINSLERLGKGMLYGGVLGGLGGRVVRRMADSMIKPHLDRAIQMYGTPEFRGKPS